MTTRRALAGVLALALGAVALAQVGPNPRQQPGAAVTVFAPGQHDLYDGRFVLSAGRLYIVGGLNDPVPWDHIDNDASELRLVAGTAEIDVDEIANTGTFEARMKIPEGDLVVAIDRFNEFSTCQNGGIVAALHERDGGHLAVVGTSALQSQRRSLLLTGPFVMS
jgi:hypothetical protein